MTGASQQKRIELRASTAVQPLYRPRAATMSPTVVCVAKKPTRLISYKVLPTQGIIFWMEPSTFSFQGANRSQNLRPFKGKSNLTSGELS